MTQQYPQLHLDNQLCFSLYSLSRLVTQQYTPLLKKLDITYPQYLVFMVLWENYEHGNQPLAIKVLSQKLLLDTGTLTPLLKRLEAKGLLSRTRSPEDERVVLVALTEEGIALRERAKTVPIELFCSSGLDALEVNDLRNQLQGVLARLAPASAKE